MSDILTERSARLLAGQKIATEYDVHVLLSGLVERAGSQKAVADSLGVSSGRRTRCKGPTQPRNNRRGMAVCLCIHKLCRSPLYP